MKYTVGYLFNNDASRVALILKARPEWQAGKWNGIGGKVESKDSSPFDCMVREFREETGVEFYDWCHFATVKVSGHELYYFKGFSSDAQNKIRFVKDEIPSVFRLDAMPTNLVVYNDWLIPLALNSYGCVYNIEELEK